MLLAGGVERAQPHAAAHRDGEDGGRHQGGEEAAHEIECAVQVAHPLVRQRHHQVVPEQRIAKRERQDQDRGVAADRGLLLFRHRLRATARQLARVGRDVGAHEAPRQPRQQREDGGVAHEKPLRRQPPPHVRPRVVQPRIDERAAEQLQDEQHHDQHRERRRRLRQPDHHARPVSLGELLRGGEHHAPLR